MEDDRGKGVAQLSAGNKFSRVAWSAVVYVITAGLLLLTVALVGIRLLGFTPYVVGTTTAAPDYRLGDLLYIHRVNFADIQKGDAVMYVATGDLTVMTRRVIAVDGGRRQVSVGESTQIEEGRILGKVVFSIPWMGYVSVWLTGTTAKYVAAGLLTVLLFAVFAEQLRTGR